MKTTKHNITNTAEPIKPGYKKTSVGIIPEDWEVKKLDNIFEFKNGVNGDKSKYGEGIKFINVMEVIYNNRITSNMISGSIMIPERQKNLFLVKKGDVLFNRTSETQDEIALAALYDDEEEVVFGGFVIRGRPKKNILINNFKKYCFDSSMMRKQIISKGQGAIRFNIGQSDLRKVNLPIPPLPEQKAIADCLSTWDKGIEKLSALIASKKEQKKGLMQQLLTGKKRLDGFTEEWKTKRLNVIGKVNYGTRIVKGNVEEGEYFVYGGGGKTFTNKEYNREDRMIIARFAMSKECARFVKGKFYLNDSGLTVDANEKTNQSFLDYLLFFNQHNIYKLRAGGAQQNLDVQAFRGISLSIPSIEEQTAIAEVLTAADKEIELLEQKLEAFKIQKKGLMQVLLTGTKRLV